MLQFLRNLIHRPSDQAAMREKIYKNEKSKAEKKLKTLRALLKRQPSRKTNTLGYDIYSCQDTYEVYARVSKIPLTDRIEGLQRLNDEMVDLERIMRKQKLSLFRWMIQSFNEYRQDRAHRLEQARRQREYNRRMDAIPFRY